MKNHRLLSVLIFFLASNYTCCQDAQFSQYYASPLYLNPGLVGMSGDVRANLHYRSQWVGSFTNYQTFISGFDMPLKNRKIAMGGYILQDNAYQENGSKQSKLSINLNGGYLIRLNKKWSLNMGLQLSLEQSTLGFSRLIFDDQIDNNGTVNRPTQESLLDEKIIYPDFSAGTVLYCEKLWLGISVFHINQPSTSRIKDSSNFLPFRLSSQIGYKIPLTYRWRNIIADYNNNYLTVMLHYQKQGMEDQLSTGINFNYSPLILGLWYRGIIFKEGELNKKYNQDAIVIMSGINFNNLTIGYSFDLPIGGFSMSEGQSHEVTLRYDFNVYPNYRKQKKRRLPPTQKCPLPNF